MRFPPENVAGWMGRVTAPVTGVDGGGDEPRVSRRGDIGLATRETPDAARFLGEFIANLGRGHSIPVTSPSVIRLLQNNFVIIVLAANFAHVARVDLALENPRVWHRIQHPAPPFIDQYRSEKLRLGMPISLFESRK